MASATVAPDTGLRLVLKADDQPARDHEALEFDSSRTALDKTLARLAAGREDAEMLKGLGYSCEWWPLDE